MKNCRESIDLLLDYLEGRLAPPEKAALDDHFAACPPCLEFVRSYRETPRILRDVTREPLPAEVRRRLEEFLRRRE